MDEVLDLHVLNLLKREVIVVLWSTTVHNIFIDTDVAPTEVTNRQGCRTICTQLANKRGNSCFMINYSI